ncbi:hypothetical protein RFI_05988 [Reticulomyxa filosa]|uniref:Uncharacterized protein n=1 Tax=Reticulomyxa filosa TaxID=46433 RepID=X6NXU2_RETFI|nr:hypothetical protein RFI_05988 [Reticulomyxa filosa]|eukprot:ETO31130.1 hypothetical protein RFI_05988 [Reticulomyxa filosa]
MEEQPKILEEKEKELQKEELKLVNEDEPKSVQIYQGDNRMCRDLPSKHRHTKKHPFHDNVKHFLKNIAIFYFFFVYYSFLLSFILIGNDQDVKECSVLFVVKKLIDTNAWEGLIIYEDGETNKSQRMIVHLPKGSNKTLSPNKY